MRICTVALSVVLAAVFLIGIFLLIPFPLAVFPSLVKSQVYLRQTKDGQFPTATYFWSRLPAIQYYDFYFFNITNPDEVTYNGAKAELVEVGPYSWAETEFKEDIDFLSEGNFVHYRNNKSWVFSPELSCFTCGHDDPLVLPNAAYMSVVYMQKKNGMKGAIVNILDILTLLLGEAPIRTVSMGGVTFDSYPDPFMSLVNSNLTKTLMNIMGSPLPLPNVKAMGYFPLYNHTSDEDYLSKTGKGNTDDTALIQRWANMSHLPWWGDRYSQDISNSGDGSFQKPQLTKKDSLKQFQSFTCRSYYLHYDSDNYVNGIHAYRFKIDKDAYDTTSEKNKGYRYENVEKIDYFPDWPCNKSFHHYNPLQPNCTSIDCSIRNNWCDNCCNGTHYRNTVFLPPGIIPLRCLPGQNVLLPFAGFLSPPHFLWSPREVQNSMGGLHPDNVKHDPGAFDIQPMIGSTIGGQFKMQLSVPIYNDRGFTLMNNLRNTFLPSFWLNIRVVMQSYAHDYVFFNTVTLPNIVLGVGIGLVASTVLSWVLWMLIIIRHRRRSHQRTSYEEDAFSVQ